MKKILFMIAMSFLFIGSVFAKDCTIVSGTGKNIGDEVACGDELFYVISNDGDTIKLMGKYNLMVGETFEKLDLDDVYFEDSYLIYLNDEVREKLKEGYYIDDVYRTEEADGGYTYHTIYFAKHSDYVHQYVYFDDRIDTEKEALTHKDVKALVNEGYGVYDYYFDKDGIFMVDLVKSINWSYKTLYFEDDLSMVEIYQRDDVKELLEEGYVLGWLFYDDSFVKNDSFHIYEVNGATFYKGIEEDKYVYLFDEPVSEADLNSFLDNDVRINELYDKYDYIDEKLSDTLYDASGVGSTMYYGVIFTTYYGYENFYTGEVRQNEIALGAHGTGVKPDPIEVGVLSGYDVTGDFRSSDVFMDSITNYRYYDNTQSYWYLKEYKNQLKDLGYKVKSVNTLTLEELMILVEEVSGEEIPIYDWIDAEWEEDYDEISDGYFYRIGSIKDIVSEEYSWLWGTTYWLRSGILDDYGYMDYTLFVESKGDLCADYYCAESVGAGLRPVITMNAEDISFVIETKVEGKGSVEVVETARYKDLITFEVKPDKGYVLKVVKVTDSKGNVVTYEDYKFTMPEDNVIIEAIFEVENPNTAATSMLLIGVFMVISILTFIKYKKKKDWLEN